MNNVNEIEWAIEIFKKYGINAVLDNNNQIIISHYEQPKEKTFKELGISEDELIKNVATCEGKFDTRKSALTTFPLQMAREIRLYDDTNIKEMPELRLAGILVANKILKKLPKLKTVGSVSLENSPIKAFPKLKQAGILVAQNSALEDLSALERVGKLCIIDCPLNSLKSLEYGQDIFICASDENKKINLTTLPNLSEVEKLFVANSTLKTVPKLTIAQKLAFYNCEIKSVKSSVKAEVEVENSISDEELTNRFDTFTDWYNSDVLQKSMDLLGNLVNQIKS